jgi:hypothetical protein
MAGVILALDLLLAATWMPALAQVGGDKKGRHQKNPRRSPPTRRWRQEPREWTDHRGQDRSETEIALRAFCVPV